MSQFFPSIVKTVTYKGEYYGMPWFINAQGLFYRTDLVKTPPKTPQQVVADAQAAMKQDPSLKEGIAFEGAKYEGSFAPIRTSWVASVGRSMLLTSTPQPT